MKASFLEILDLLDFDSSLGVIKLENRRVLIFDYEILGELRKLIIEFIGWEKCKYIVFQFGYHVGREDAQNLGRLYNWETKEEFFRSGIAMQTQRGQGKAVLDRFEYNPEGGHLIFQGKWYNSYEVESHERYELTPSGPVCYVLSGYLSGFATICFDHPTLVIEQQCSLPDSHYCSFEGRLLEEWGDEGKMLMDSYKIYDLREKLERLKKDIKDYQKSEPTSIHSTSGSFEKEFSDSPNMLSFRSQAMRRVMDMLRQVARSETTVLLQGETGTGKEVIARSIHAASSRFNSPFVAIDSSALPETLLESELFGHKKGAYTGANKDRDGLLIEAGFGTVFLDEIGDLTLPCQSKLLRVLEEKKVRPLGCNKEETINARIIVGTNKDLEKMVEEGKFRSDLFYRINVFPIEIPPLRDHKEDILPLVKWFLKKYAPKSKGISPQALQIFESYTWPGNIRQVEHIIERASIIAGNNKIQPEHLPLEMANNYEARVIQTIHGWPTLAEIEKRYIAKVLGHCNGKKRNAAKILGIGNNTLWRKLRQGLTDSVTTLKEE